MAKHRERKKKKRSEMIREEIKEMMEGIKGEEKKGKDILSMMLRMSLKALIVDILEEEVEEFINAGRYERGEGRRGRRNGYWTKRVKTAEGEVEVDVPRVRESEEPYRSKILEVIPERSERLVVWIIEGYGRGLSTRDLEEILRGEDGKPMLSRATISKVTEQMWEEYTAFMESNLEGYELEYLWLDGVYEPIRKYVKSNQAVLCAWGMTRRGEMVLLGLEPGEKESYTAWRDFLYGLIRRGLREPVVVITDGSPALIKAVKDCFPRSFRQRCIAHKTRNVLAKVPDHAHDEIKQQLNDIYYAPSFEEGRHRAKLFIEKYERIYPRAVRSFAEDLEASLTHLRFPARHRKILRTTNRIERVFLEQKRRTKVSGFFYEKAALKLIFGAIVRSTKNWRGIHFTDIEIAQVEALRKENNLSQLPSLDYDIAHKIRQEVA